MPTPTLNLDSVELVSTERRAPLNGAPSSQDYNDSMREVVTDLASIADSLNTVVLPLLSSLPAGDPLKPLLDGDGIFASHATDSLFYDSTASQQLTVADVLRRINASVQSVANTVTDLSARVLSLQTRLAT